MKHNFLLLRGLAREQGHWGEFPERLLKVPGVNSVHSVDLPGNGQFFKITSPVSIREMAEFVHSHNPIGKDQKTTLLAVSMGAMIAIELVTMYPENYCAAFLMNTSMSGVSPLYQRLRPRSLETFYRILRSGTAREKEEHILDLVSSGPGEREPLLEEWTRLAHARPTNISNALRQLIAAGRYRLPKLKPLVPIYLMASKADRMVDFRCSLEIAKKWELPLTIHEHAGHELAMDAPDWVCDVLTDGIKQLVRESKAGLSL